MSAEHIPPHPNPPHPNPPHPNPPHPNPPHPNPTWVAVFDPITALRFVDVVAEEVQRRWGRAARFDRSQGTATLADGSVIGFANAAREVALFDEPYWRTYLSSMLADLGAVDSEALLAGLRSFAQVRSRLRVRLWAQPRFEPLIERPITASTSLALVAATPAGCVPIGQSVFEAWNRRLDQVWALACANTARRSTTRHGSITVGRTTFILIEGDLYTTGDVVDLSRVMPHDSAHGALVAAPASRILLIHPIRDPRSALTDALGMTDAAKGFIECAPNPLSYDLFWYRGVGDLVGANELGLGEPTGFSDRPLA